MDIRGQKWAGARGHEAQAHKTRCKLHSCKMVGIRRVGVRGKAQESRVYVRACKGNTVRV